MLFSSKTALLLIDVQQGFDEPFWGVRNNMGAERNMAELLNAWRHAGLPVLHVQHCSTEPNSPLRPGQPGHDIMDFAKPVGDEPLFQKTVNSGFIGTDLEQHLRDQHIEALVIVGLTTNHCVSTTTRMSGNLGFRTHLISDATATFDRTDQNGVHYPAEILHATALASLHEEFAEVIDTSTALSRLPGDRALPKPTEALPAGD